MLLIYELLRHIAAYAVVVGAVVTVHEFGHFVVARACGVRVLRFAIGFGSPLISYKDPTTGTVWQIGWIPLGGYVMLFGDASASERESLKLTAEEQKHAYAYQSVARRMAIVLAGPLINYILAFVIAFGMIYSNGVLVIPPVVAQVVEDSPAQGKLLPHDRVLSVNGTEVYSFTELAMNIDLYKTMGLVLVVERQHQPLVLNIPPLKKQEKLGIVADVTDEHVQELGIADSATYALWRLYTIHIASWEGLKQILLGDRSMDDLQGTVATAKVAAQGMQNGAVSMLNVIAMISLGLGFTNLLPIPLLDGGRLMFLVFEAIFRRPLPHRIEMMANWMGLAIIVSVLVCVNINDIKKLPLG